MNYEEFKRAWCTDQAIDDEILWERSNRARDFGRLMARRYNEAFWLAFTGETVVIPVEPETPDVIERRRIASQYIEYESRVLMEYTPWHLMAWPPVLEPQK